jgi:Flp pilus assembly pilin Flp
MKLFKFTKDEDGAVTVVWVVLTAALVLVGGVVVNAIRGGMEDVAADINTQLSATSVS